MKDVKLNTEMLLQLRSPRRQEIIPYNKNNFCDILREYFYVFSTDHRKSFAAILVRFFFVHLASIVLQLLTDPP